jgi:hypothetical protein
MIRPHPILFIGLLVHQKAHAARPFEELVAHIFHDTGIQVSMKEISAALIDRNHESPSNKLTIRQRACLTHKLLFSQPILGIVGDSIISRFISQSLPADSRASLSNIWTDLKPDTDYSERLTKVLLNPKAGFHRLPCREFYSTILSRAFNETPAPHKQVPGSCGLTQKHKWLSELFRSESFLRSELKRYRAPNAGSNTKPEPAMIDNTIRSGDWMALISAAIATHPRFSQSDTPESYGDPPGPYACHTRNETTPEPSNIISTTFYYWYDFPTSNNARSESGLEDIFSIQPRSRAGMHYLNPIWFKSEIDQITKTGINTILPVYRGGPLGKFAYSDIGLAFMARALLGPDQSKMRIGLLLDGALFDPMNNRLNRRLDISTTEGSRALAATARNFYSLVPTNRRTTIHGRPLVYLRNLAYSRAIRSSAIKQFRTEFKKVFETEPYLVFPREEIVERLGLAPTAEARIAIERLGNTANNAFDILVKLTASEGFFHSLGGSKEALARQLYHNACHYVPNNKEIENWRIQSNRVSRQEVVKIFLHYCLPNTMESWRARILGTTPQYTNHMLAQLKEALLNGEVFSEITQAFGSNDFFHQTGRSPGAFNNALYESLTGSCPTDANLVRLSSMYETMKNRTKIASFILREKKPLERFIAGWHADLLVASSVDFEEEIRWQPTACSPAGRLTVVTPGHDDKPMARMRKSHPIVISRNHGKFYGQQWKQFFQRKTPPALIHVESWNGYHDGTAIAATREHNDTYLTMTRDYLRKVETRGKHETQSGKINRSISSLPFQEKETK